MRTLPARLPNEGGRVTVALRLTHVVRLMNSSGGLQWADRILDPIEQFRVAFVDAGQLLDDYSHYSSFYSHYSSLLTLDFERYVPIDNAVTDVWNCLDGRRLPELASQPADGDEHRVREGIRVAIPHGLQEFLRGQGRLPRGAEPPGH